jgi:hypothetical protein
MNKTIIINFGDNRTLKNFKKVCAIASTYGYVPHDDTKSDVYATRIYENGWVNVMLRDGKTIDANDNLGFDTIVHWDKDPGELVRLLEAQPKTVKFKLNRDYTATIKQDKSVEVGCQTFSKETMEEFFKVWNEIN